ncbi:MAG: hypothetical protein M3464_14240 [Chloroflexota bacterium]|nr:hypothetical protein [Chloroflexota bacterium]
MSRVKIQRRLTVLERRPRPKGGARGNHWDLESFTVEELERMVPLAEKYEAAGGAVAWTPEEVAVFEQLEQVYRDRCPSRA